MDKRYREILELGIINLMSGNWKEELVVPDDKVLVALSFSWDSLHGVVRRLEESPLPMRIAGKDYPFHSTLAAAFGEIPPEVKERIKSSRLVSLFLGKTLWFNDVLVDGGNVLLVSSPILEEVVLARGAIDEQLSNGLVANQPFQPYRGIFHSTIARVMKKGDASTYSKYLQIIFSLGAEIRENPLGVKVKNVLVGKVKDLLKN